LADFGHVVAERLRGETRAQPRGTLRFLLAHHALQWALVIPMNTYYSHLVGYHELLFLLQVGATVAAFANLYGQSLAASSKPQSALLLALHGFTLVVMAYTRWMHYWWSLSKCLMRFYEDKAYGLLLIGSCCGAILMPYIGASLISGQYRKCQLFASFYRMTEKDEPCPSPAAPAAAAGNHNRGDEADDLAPISADVKHAESHETSTESLASESTSDDEEDDEKDDEVNQPVELLDVRDEVLNMNEWTSFSLPETTQAAQAAEAQRIREVPSKSKDNTDYLFPCRSRPVFASGIDQEQLPRLLHQRGRSAASLLESKGRTVKVNGS
jgi:hypothetical protein